MIFRILWKIDSTRLEDGFLVLYSGLEITRQELDNKIKYQKDDYRQLEEFYTQKICQIYIYIVGEYAHMMSDDPEKALRFVNNYFQADQKQFLGKYFPGERSSEIERNITPEKFNKLFKATPHEDCMAVAPADFSSDCAKNGAGILVFRSTPLSLRDTSPTGGDHVFQGVFVQYDGKDASKCRAKRKARSWRGVAQRIFTTTKSKA